MGNSNNALVAIVLIIIAVLVWGLIGSSEAEKIGTTCDLGMGDDGSTFCWKWHRNEIGQLSDNLQDFFNRDSNK